MIAESAGIGSDIDLTGDRLFRKGVKPLASECPYDPGTLPWDKNGIDRYRNRKGQVDETGSLHIRSNFSISAISSWSRTTSGVDTYHPNDFSDEVFKLFQKSGDLSLIETMPILPEFHKGRLMVNAKRHGWGIGSYDYSYDGIIADYASAYMSANGTAYDSNWQDSTNSYIVVQPDSYVDITPEEFGPFVSLTCYELDGGLITGSANDVADKIRFREFMQKALAIIDTLERHRRGTKEAMSESAVIRTCAHRWHELHDDKPITTRAHRSSILCDQSGWYKKRDDKTIDYFFQKVRSDRGLALIRRPRNSHELRVDLETREFIEEEDIPIADWSRLTYEKGFLGGAGAGIIGLHDLGDALLESDDSITFDIDMDDDIMGDILIGDVL